MLVALVLVLMLAGAFGPRVYARLRTLGHVYTVDSVPQRRVTIVLGALVYPNGQLSSMLADRVATGAALYHAGKTDVLLFSGDNHVETYNEPEAMRRYALQLGVPYDAIVLDYAGFRTYDSCYRARDIFQVDQAILVTQRFHLDRALLTCNELGVAAIGVAADEQRPEGYHVRSMIFSQIREFPATMFAVFDLIHRPEPTFLGDPLPILAKER
ncbi:MAG: YdcF family protein [Anaerolineae bacterium]|nr:YdcF family protein [Anaerolineae bacterium]